MFYGPSIGEELIPGDINSYQPHTIQSKTSYCNFVKKNDGEY